ncbi:MAG: carbonic anhydrase [Rhodothermales bacterium]|jgi:carbonic anhydrase
MKKTLFVAVVLAAAACAPADSGIHWSYSGQDGPENWGSLSADFEACSTGQRQSPINLTGFNDTDLPALKIVYETGGSVVLNNGHTIQVNYDAGSQVEIDGTTFTLLQYHFHSPSENQINGVSYPMEVHLVHADAQGNLAVIGVMFEEGTPSASLAQVWDAAPATAGESVPLTQATSAGDLLPMEREYYRFDGSLTTPPCSEGVKWVVMKEAVSASAAQVEHFSELMHHANNRPLQPVNGREIQE